MDEIARRTAPPTPARTCAWRVEGGYQVRLPVDDVARALENGADDLVLLILDYSGSMREYKQRLNETAAAIAEAALESGTGDRLIGVVFGHSAAALSADELALLRGTDVSMNTNLKGRHVMVGSSTNYGDALSAAVDAINTVDPQRRARVTALFMTDGQPGNSLHISVARERIRTHPSFDLQPVLFSAQNKADPNTQRLLATLYELHRAAHEETISREDFDLHRVRFVNTGSDGLTQTLQAARGLLVRQVFMQETDFADAARTRLLLGARGAEAVGFLPRAAETDVALTLRIWRADGDRAIDIQVPIVDAPAPARADADADVLLQLRAALAGDLQLEPAARARLATRARACLATRADTDDGARALIDQIANFERDAARAAAFLGAAARAASSLQTTAPDSLLQLLDSVGAMMAVAGGRITRASAKRGAISRLQRLTATTGDKLNAALAAVERDVRARLGDHAAQARYPDYLSEDLQLDDLDRENGDAPFLLMDAPGCELAEHARADASDDDLMRRIAIAMNHADCARARVAGWLTRASLAGNVAAGVSPLRRRMIALYPTDDVNSLLASANVFAGALMVGELVTMTTQNLDALLAVGSALLDADTLANATPVQLTAYTHCCKLYYHGMHGQNSVYDGRPLCPLAASRSLAKNERNAVVLVRSIRTGAMMHALHTHYISAHALIAELLRKRVAAIARMHNAHALLSGAREALLDAFGLAAAARECGLEQLRAAQGDVAAVRATLKAIRMRERQTLAPLPGAMPAARMLDWIANFVGDGDEGAGRQQDAYAWPECPSWSTFVRTLRASHRLRSLASTLIYNTQNGWLRQQTVDELNAIGRELLALGDDHDFLQQLLTDDDARSLFDVALQTIDQKDQAEMQPLQGLPATVPSFETAAAVALPATTLIVLLSTNGDDAQRAPGGELDRLLAHVIETGGAQGGGFEQMRAFEQLRACISPQLALDAESLTRRALLHCVDGLLPEMLQSMFGASRVVTPARLPVRPGARVFHRRLNWLCARLGLNEPRAYSGGEVDARATALGVQDANLVWLLRGVALAPNPVGTPALRISHLAGIDRESAGADDALRAVYDAIVN